LIKPAIFNPKKNGRIFLWGFLAFYLLFAFLTFRDYGITCDEPDWYVSGGALIKHYLHIGKDDNGRITGNEESAYSCVYPAVLRVFSPSDDPERLHLLNLLFGGLGFLAIFEMLFAAYGNGLWALAGPLALFLTFRFSGDMPANPKDGPFAVLFLACLALIFLFRSRWKDRGWEALVLGSFIGVTACARTVGLTLLPLWAFYRFYQYWTDEKRPSLDRWLSKEWVNGLLLFTTSQFWMMVFWPYLGGDYFGNYLSILQSSRRFAWDGAIMFMGKVVQSTHLPWYYMPGWFLVTMPLFLLVFFGLSWFFFKRMKKPARDLFVLLGGALVLQVVLYLALKPVLYNALRHYLFLVPPFCVMAVMGLVESLKGGWPLPWKRTMLALSALNVLALVVQLVQLYPYQYIYFNELVGGLKGAAGKYETDYWGASLKEAAQWLSNNGAPDLARTYRVRTCSTREQQTHYFKDNLKGDNEMKDADYRIEPNNPVVLERDHVSNQEIQAETIYVVQREGVPLYYVLKLK